MIYEKRLVPIKVRSIMHKNGEFYVFHNANMSVQYTAIFHGYENDYFHMKNCNIFLIFAQNIDYGYTYPKSMFWSKSKKNCIPL